MKFQSGDVVYWVERHRQSPYEYYIDCGIVDEEFSDAVCAERLHIRDHRFIDNIPYNDFPQFKNYENTKLFEIEWRSDKDWSALGNLKINKPEDIKTAFEQGILIYLKDYDQTVPHSEIDKKLGWRIKKEHDDSVYVYPHVTLQKDNAFKTYAEAQAVIDAQEAEWKRQSELTDEEWSVEQIDHDLQRWTKIYSKSSEEVQKVRDFLLGMDKVEDIETRVFGGDFQWKYWKNKKWRTIVLD